MKRYPFWMIKSDAKQLLRDKWNPLVLALFIPFLLLVAFALKMLPQIVAMPATPKQEEYIFYVNLVILGFSILMQLLTVGIYDNLKPTKRKASCFSVYAVAGKSVWKMLPTVLVATVIPFFLTEWLSGAETTMIYDYLLFSYLDFDIYLVILEALSMLVWIVSLYLQYSLIMVPAITVEHPEYGGFRLIKESFRFTRGNRFYLMMLSVSFIGWLLLGSLVYIGVLWAVIYMYAANYAYYRRITILEEPIIVSDIEN